MSPLEEVESLTTHNQTTKFVQNVIYPATEFDEMAQKRITFTTDVPHPNASIVADVVSVEETSYSKFEHLKLHIEEATEKVRLAHVRLYALMPTQGMVAKWSANKPILSLYPCMRLFKSVIDDKNLAKDLQSIWEETDPDSELRSLVGKLMDEIEIGVRTITTVSQEQIEQSKPELLMALPRLITSANALRAQFGRSRQLPLIQPRSDPLLFKREYEDY